jgi:hypothetical protein
MDRKNGHRVPNDNLKGLKADSQPPRPKKNAYICNNLHVTVTEDVDEGVTPPYMPCPECGRRATSRMYCVNQDFDASHEWFKPNEAEIIKEAQFKATAYRMAYENVLQAVQKHIAAGGLLLRMKNQPMVLTRETGAFDT